METQNIVSDRESVVVCPYCGHTNDTESSRCGQCWSRLRGVSVLSRAEGAEVVRRLLSVRRWRKRVRWGIIAGVALLLAAWIAFVNIGTTRFLPPASTTISASAEPGDWPMFQRDHTHSGIVSDSVASPRGSLKWQFETAGPLFSSPAIVDGRVYVTTGDRRIVALDEQTGELIWEQPASGPINSTPAVAGDLVFYGLRDGSFHALDSYTGERLWQYKTGNFIFSSPAVHNGVVYIGSGDSMLYAFDAQTGEMRWAYDARNPILTPPAVNDEVVAVVSQSGVLHIVDTNTGNLRLDYMMTSISNGSPAILDNHVFTADEAGGIRAVDWRQRVIPFEKSARWLRTQLFIWGMVNTVPPQKGYVWADRKRGGGFSNTPVIVGDLLYIGSHAGILYALDHATGDEVWKFKTNAPIMASASAAGGVVYVGDTDGYLYGIDARTGEELWRFKTGARIDAAPAIANGVLFLTSRDGTLYAIE